MANSLMKLVCSLLFASVAFLGSSLAEDPVEKETREKRGMATLPVPDRFKTEAFAAVFRKAAAHVEKMDFAQVAAECREIVKSNPADRDVLIWAYSMLGHSLFRAKDYEGAKQAYESMLANVPPSAEGYRYFLGRAWLGLAHAEIGAGNNSDALKLVLKVIKEFPDPIGGWSWAAMAVRGLPQCFPDEKDRGKALEVLEELWQEHKEKDFGANILMEIGRIYEEEKKLDVAIKKYQELVDAFPKSAVAKAAQFRMDLCRQRLKRMEDTGSRVHQDR